MFSKKIRSALLFAMISLLPIINCSSPVSSTGDVMFVSLPEQAVFFRQGSGPLAKSVAVKIDPIAIRVLSVFHKPVIHEDNYGMHPMPKTASSSFWDSTSGHRRNRWEDWVEYFLSDTVEEIIYQGVLERSGDFAKGKVAVKKGGYTSVAVGFIMPGDTLFSSNRYSAGPYWASYVWNDTISKWTYPTYGNGDTLAFEQYPPAAPAGLTADTSEGVLSLAWKPVKGATNYYICYTKGNSVDTSGYYFSTSKPYYIAPSLSLITDSTYTFAVRAGNSAGRSSFSAPVTAVVPRPTVPKTPANLSAKADSGRIRLTWSAVKNASSYYVYFAKGSVDTTRSRYVYDTTMLLDTLTADSTYAFAVRAVNSAGSSAISAPVTIVAPRPIPPAAPSYISASATGSTTISVSWGSATRATIYKIYWTAGTTVTTASLTFDSSRSTFYTISGLNPETRYAVAVTACNSAGASTLSVTDTATTRVALGIPSGLVADTSEGKLSLRWDSASSATSYLVYYTKGTVLDTSGYSYSSYTTTYSSFSLTTDSVYTFAVRAVRSSERSPLCSAVTIKAPAPTVPKIPSNLSVKADSGRIRLTWSAVKNASYYYVYFAKGSVDTTRSRYVYDTTLVLDTLTADSTYAFAVRAVNSVGSSAISAPVTQVVPKPLPPPTPSYASASPSGSSSISVYWPGTARASYYLVYYSQDSSVSTASPHDSVTSSSATITGLQAGTLYSIAVSAGNVWGVSALSPKTYARTGAIPKQQW